MGLDRWKEFFRDAGADIFDVIENGILLAASDFPGELRARRSHIAEALFSPPNSARCCDCERAGLQLNGKSDRGRVEVGEYRLDGGGGKEKQCGAEVAGKGGGRDVTVTDSSYGEAQGRSEEAEEDNRTVQEVLRIKRILAAMNDQPEFVLLELLTKLRSMEITMEILEATKIGKTVNRLHKHSSKRIVFSAHELVEEWKAIAEKWVSSNAATEGATPESANISCVEQSELAVPPLEEGVFLDMLTLGPGLSTIFDGIEDEEDEDNSDDGNFPNNREPEKNENSHAYTTEVRENSVQTTNHNGDAPVRRKLILKMAKPSLTSSQATVEKNLRTSSNDSRLTPMEQQKSNCNQSAFNSIQTKSQKIASGAPKDRNHLDEQHIREKLETTKRKLQEGYRQASNAKKQRATQVISELDSHKQSELKKRTIGRHNRSFS